MTTAETYVTAAYLVFLGVVLLYVVIYSFKVRLLERMVADLTAPSAAIPEGAEEQEEAEKKQAVLA